MARALRHLCYFVSDVLSLWVTTITKQGLGKEESLQMDSKFDSGSKHKTG